MTIRSLTYLICLPRNSSPSSGRAAASGPWPKIWRRKCCLSLTSKLRKFRDRTLFRAWLFKIARNALCRHYRKQTREVETVDLAEIPDRLVADRQKPASTPAFEFLHWMTFLDSRERELMTLRFIEQWEYHEIAAAQAIPIGTVQWRVFNATKKLAPYLKTRKDTTRRAA